MTDNSSTSSNSTNYHNVHWQQGVHNVTYENTTELWLAGISKNCARHNFNFVQFIDSEEDEKVGSTWQILVCQQLNVPDSDAERFWLEKGRAAARKAISRRRSNTANAMKKKFKGKQTCHTTCWVQAW
jgi:G:T-mismatch repair DNA endonuclease (very short patch repair protein)